MCDMDGGRWSPIEGRGGMEAGIAVARTRAADAGDLNGTNKGMEKRTLRARVQPDDIEIPKDNPFKHDCLDRKESVGILARLICSVQGPGVFGIDADWGNGKTTFLRMLHRYLVNNEVPVVSFNAWESDYVSDPFTAIATELTDGLGEYVGESDEETRSKIDTGVERANRRCSRPPPGRETGAAPRRSSGGNRRRA